MENKKNSLPSFISKQYSSKEMADEQIVFAPKRNSARNSILANFQQRTDERDMKRFE